MQGKCLLRGSVIADFFFLFEGGMCTGTMWQKVWRGAEQQKCIPFWNELNLIKMGPQFHGVHFLMFTQMSPGSRHGSDEGSGWCLAGYRSSLLPSTQMAANTTFSKYEYCWHFWTMTVDGNWEHPNKWGKVLDSLKQTSAGTPKTNGSLKFGVFEYTLLHCLTLSCQPSCHKNIDAAWLYGEQNQMVFVFFQSVLQALI